MATITKVSLAEFLSMPDTKSASELIAGVISQKPTPHTEHSRIQYKLCAAINQVAEAVKIACALNYSLLSTRYGIRLVNRS